VGIYKRRMKIRKLFVESDENRHLLRVEFALGLFLLFVLG
jgi:hypothetical protein